MKYLLIAVSCILPGSLVLAQKNKEQIFLKTTNKMHFYYVEMSNAVGKVYKMGGYYDKAGSGYSVRNTDTITKQPGGEYLGASTRIITENNKAWLIIPDKKSRKLLLDTIQNLNDCFANLNNAYYLDHYMAMSDELNKRYPLNHHSFRNGFYTWRELPDKNMEPAQFSAYAGQRLKQIKDSLITALDQYTSLTNNMLQHIHTIDYNTLKDSLAKLPLPSGDARLYYTTVVKEISKQQPEYFFRLAEDYPNNRADILWTATDNNKEAIQRLRAVQGHDAVKKEFFKNRKFEKTMPYRIIGMYGAIAVCIILLID